MRRHVGDWAAPCPSKMGRNDFVRVFGGVFAHSPWIAKQAITAGLDAPPKVGRRAFTDLNAAHVAKFGFPFKIAAGDQTRSSILAAFRSRLTHSHDAEFADACRQVERIAYHRLQDLFA